MADAFAALSRAGRLAGFEATERFFEIGTPAGLADLEAHLAGSSDQAHDREVTRGRRSARIDRPDEENACHWGQLPTCTKTW